MPGLVELMAAVRARESSNNYQENLPKSPGFIGAYQFGRPILTDLGFVTSAGNSSDPSSWVWTGKIVGGIKVDSLDVFLGTNGESTEISKVIQDTAFVEELHLNWSRFRGTDVEFYADQVLNEEDLSISGLLMASHLVGNTAIRTSYLTSGGVNIPKDGNGTEATEYIRLFADFDINDISGLSPTVSLPSGFSGYFISNPDLPYEINGGDGKDELFGFGGEDTLKGGGNDDKLDGGGGNDTAAYDNNCSEYVIRKLSDGEITVTHFSGSRSDGADTLLSIEKIKFLGEELSVADIEFDEDGKFICAPSKDASILIDVSGSMQDDIDRVKAEAKRFINGIFADDADARVNIITYNDTGQIRQVLSFTDDPAAAIAALGGVNVIGGGAEPIYGAMLSSMNGIAGDFRTEENVLRQIVNFTDEPPADPEKRDDVIAKANKLDVVVPARAAATLAAAVAEETAATVNISTVLLSGGGDAATVAEYQSLADATGGSLVSLENDEDAVNALVQLTSSQVSYEGTEGDDVITANVGGNLIDALGGDDRVSSFAGNDYVTLGDGADVLEGSSAEVFGDLITDFTLADAILLKGEVLSRDELELTRSVDEVALASLVGGANSEALVLNGDFSGGDFMAAEDAGDTIITYETFLPSLSEAVAVDVSAVNGTNNQAFLTGDGSSGFRIMLDSLAVARNNNAIGVYEIDALGNIVDVQLLIANANADKSATVDVVDVEDGNQLGFFLVQNGAAWADTLAAGDDFRFVNSVTGLDANVGDGSDVALAVNGEETGQTVFHSFSETLNSDGVQHALSGVEAGGTAITLGFEDLTGGGDRDYQDVVFSVETFDLVA